MESQNSPSFGESGATVQDASEVSGIVYGSGGLDPGINTFDLVHWIVLPLLPAILTAEPLQNSTDL